MLAFSRGWRGSGGWLTLHRVGRAAEGAQAEAQRRRTHNRGESRRERSGARAQRCNRKTRKIDENCPKMRNLPGQMPGGRDDTGTG